MSCTYDPRHAGVAVLRTDERPLVTRDPDGFVIEWPDRLAVLLGADRLGDLVTGWLLALGDTLTGYAAEAMEAASTAALDRARDELARRRSEHGGLSE
jgi:hypothetical protein